MGVMLMQPRPMDETSSEPSLRRFMEKPPLFLSTAGAEKMRFFSGASKRGSQSRGHRHTIVYGQGAVRGLGGAGLLSSFSHEQQDARESLDESDRHDRQ